MRALVYRYIFESIYLLSSYGACNPSINGWTSYYMIMDVQHHYHAHTLHVGQPDPHGRTMNDQVQPNQAIVATRVVCV
jgi:hypothetical protein